MPSTAAAAGTLGAIARAATAVWLQAGITLVVAGLIAVNPARSVREALTDGLRALADTALSYGILGASARLWPLAGTLAVGIILVGLPGVLEGPAYSGTIALRQRHTPPAVRAQRMTTVTSVAMAASALGAAVGGAIHDPLATIFVFTAVNAVAAMVARGVGVRRRARVA